MNLDIETAALVRSIAIGSVAVLLTAKICWECGVEAFRKRLYVLDAELFEFARHGRVSTGDAAYALLRDSIRSMIRYSHQLSLSEHLATILFRRKSMPTQQVERHSRRWRTALDQIGSDGVREDLSNFRERVLIAVCGYVTFGAVPLATALTNAISLQEVFEQCRRFALRNASLVEIRAQQQARLPVAA